MAADLNFQLALIFYKSEKHNFVLEYEPKLQLTAFWKQATVGNAAWEALGDLTPEEASAGFVKMLTETVPSFAPWLERRLQEKAEQERREREAQERAERDRLARAEAARAEAERIEAEKARLEREQKARVQQQLEQQQQLLSQAKISAQKTAEGGLGDGLSLGPVAPHDLPYADYHEFVNSVRTREECCFNIGRGEIVTVKVPNNDDGSHSLVWQFCTVGYDIGFGLQYETTNGTKSNIEVVLPIIRCNSHEKVIVGSHSERTPGVWLFNFDNTYSMLRSKTLYLRVASDPARLKLPAPIVATPSQ